jgi:hypothetical protein
MSISQATELRVAIRRSATRKVSGGSFGTKAGWMPPRRIIKKNHPMRAPRTG